MRRAAAITGALLFAAAAACGGGGGPGGDDDGIADADPGDCVPIDMAVSSEKITLLTELAREFNGSDLADLGEACAFVRPYSKSSGAAASLLVDGWPDPEVNGEPPVVWSPAASAWGGIVNERAGRDVATGGTPFMLTPLVIAMPKPMADALGYPGTPVGFSDIAELARDPEGWARYGHPEWGPFRLGKTNPNFSTSGLNFTIAQYYAATGKTSGLSVEDLRRPEVQEFVANVESSVVHYGDITMTFLNNWFRADARGTALTYASAVAIEEKSIIDYNAGNPDGTLSPGEEPRPPKVPLVAVYPSEGTLFSDNPFFVIDAEWVTDEQRAGAAAFEQFVQLPENQQRVLEFGFRPGNPSVALAEPIVAANGVNPAEPQAELAVPDPTVLTAVLDAWAEQRKTAKVLLVMDVSGSMGDPAGPDTSTTKLELAQQAVIASLDEFKDDDLVGLWIFSTDLGPQLDQTHLELVPLAPIGEDRELLRDRVAGLFPTNGTPLYEATAAAHQTMQDGYDPEKINAIVLLTDGVNDDGELSDDDEQLEALLADLREGSEGGGSRPVRIFTISYGEGADRATLRRIAEATNAALYDASDPLTIEQVFTAVISNF